MNPNTNLKARLFDLLDEKSRLQKQQETLMKADEEKAELIEELYGQINAMRNVAEKRADMIRDLVTENRRLKQRTTMVSKADISAIQEDTIKHVINVIEREFKQDEGIELF